MFLLAWKSLEAFHFLTMKNRQNLSNTLPASLTTFATVVKLKKDKI